MVRTSDKGKGDLATARLALPAAWRSLQDARVPECIWEQVNSADPATINSHVDVFEQEVNSLVKQLDIAPEQAAWIVIETFFARLG